MPGPYMKFPPLARRHALPALPRVLFGAGALGAHAAAEALFGLLPLRGRRALPNSHRASDAVPRAPPPSAAGRSPARVVSPPSAPGRRPAAKEGGEGQEAASVHGSILSLRSRSGTHPDRSCRPAAWAFLRCVKARAGHVLTSHDRRAWLRAIRTGEVRRMVAPKGQGMMAATKAPSRLARADGRYPGTACGRCRGSRRYPVAAQSADRTSPPAAGSLRLPAGGASAGALAEMLRLARSRCSRPPPSTPISRCFRMMRPRRR